MKRAQNRKVPSGTSAGLLLIAFLALTGLILQRWSAPRYHARDRPLAPEGSAAGPSGAQAPADVPPPHLPGHRADWPSDIPARGWWQIAKRVFGEISTDRVLAEAAGVTFYVLLAIFPALAALVSIYGLIADPETIASQLSAMSGVLPEGGMKILHDQVASLVSKPSGGLGLRAVIGLLTSI